MISIVALDSSPLLLEGIEKVIEGIGDMSLTGRAGTARELMSILERGRPDILTMELDLTDKSGLEFLKDLTYQYGELPVLILSIHPSQRFALRTLRADAKGYLDKTKGLGELADAIGQIVNQNKRYISSSVAQQLAAALDGGARPPHEALSDREFEVLQLIASGNTAKEIGGMLFLSPHTVHTYRSRIKVKMNITSNVAMTRYALAHHLIN